MEGVPKQNGRRFEVVKQTKYGPELRRVRGEVALEEDVEFRELSREQKSDLRNTINAVRQKDIVEKERGGSTSIVSRRGFLQGAIAAGTTAAMAKVAYDNWPEEKEDQEYNGPEIEVENAESPEGVNFSERFEKELDGYKAFFTIDRDFVQFVGEDNQPVGEPVKLESFDGPLPEGVRVEKDQKPEYNYEIATDEFGLPKITPRWKEFKRRELENISGEKVTGVKHPVTSLRAAAQESDEPELVMGVLDGSVRSIYGINEYFINKPIKGFGGNRIDYLQQNLKFREELETVKGVPGVEFVPVPKVVQDELRFLIPGLIAQESNFNEGLVNKRSGAAGPGQFMPDTWKRYTGEEKVSHDFEKQVEVIGPAISDMYDRVLDKIGDEALDKLRSIFPAENEFLIDFITPLTIGAYNAGPDRVAEAVRLYVESVQVDDMKPGKDLFLAIAEFANRSTGGKYLSGYGKEAREYVSRVYANATVLAGEGDVDMIV